MTKNPVLKAQTVGKTGDLSLIPFSYIIGGKSCHLKKAHKLLLFFE